MNRSYLLVLVLVVFLSGCFEKSGASVSTESSKESTTAAVSKVVGTWEVIHDGGRRITYTVHSAGGNVYDATQLIYSYPRQPEKASLPNHFTVERMNNSTAFKMTSSGGVPFFYDEKTDTFTASREIYHRIN